MPTNQIAPREFHLIPTRPADSLAWIRVDVAIRLAPFALAVGIVETAWRPPWLGLQPGRLDVQLGFGLVGLPLMFVLAAAAQLALTRRLPSGLSTVEIARLRRPRLQSNREGPGGVDCAPPMCGRANAFAGRRRADRA